MWTPLEFERRVASIHILIEKDRAIECRRETDWTHRTWFGFYSRHAGFPLKASCDSFVDLVSVEMRVSRNR
jgi:regulation of enolase protein 1 (concanavalin A-like superfamily)